MSKDLQILLLASKEPNEIVVRSSCRRQNITAKITTEDDFGFPDLPKGPAQLPEGYQEALERLLSEKEFDIIIVQNNLGAGVEKAKLIPERYRKRTIILWSMYTPNAEKDYLDLGLGFEHFAEVIDSGLAISMLLPDGPTPAE